MSDKYTVISNRTIVDFIETVNERLSEGWEIVGGLQHTTNRYDVVTYSQAMMLKDKVESNEPKYEVYTSLDGKKYKVER